jgi:hypothetical protein
MSLIGGIEPPIKIHYQFQNTKLETTTAPLQRTKTSSLVHIFYKSSAQEAGEGVQVTKLFKGSSRLRLETRISDMVISGLAFVSRIP